MLRIEHLTKKYGDKKAVDDLSLHIQKGEIYGFIGHNGAGKTTTIKSCCGILNFDEGEIYVDGVSVKEKPLECKRKIAYIPDNPDLYEFMTGIKYLNFIADIFGISQSDRQARISKYTEMFEIKNALAQTIDGYSHGMKQKLAIVSALIHNPKLIIMDEPFVGLDPKSSHLLKVLMREMCDNGGAIFFSTHVLEVAEKLCDKVAIIKSGKLIKSGTMDEVKGDDSLEDVFLELEEKAVFSFRSHSFMRQRIMNFCFQCLFRLAVFSFVECCHCMHKIFSFVHLYRSLLLRPMQQMRLFRLRL